MPSTLVVQDWRSKQPLCNDGTRYSADDCVLCVYVCFKLSVIDIPIMIFFHELSKVDILSSPDTALVSFYVMHMYMHPHSGRDSILANWKFLNKTLNYNPGNYFTMVKKMNRKSFNFLTFLPPIFLAIQ